VDVMPSIETCVMVAIGGLVLLFGWSKWNDLKPGVEKQVKEVVDVIK
jgi:hypothetical protein